MNQARFKKTKYACLILFVLSLSYPVWQVLSVYSWPMIPARSTPQILIVDKATSASQFARLLQKKDLIHAPHLFLMLVRLSGLAQHLKAGVYEVKPGESAMAFAQRVAFGDVLHEHFRIIAGTTKDKIKRDLANAPYLQYQQEDWSVVASSEAKAEGLLLADTYQYPCTSSARSLLAQAHSHLVQYLNASWAHRAPDLPYKNPYELLTAASIIEKETALADERKLISGVVVNRLKKGMPLQMDPTVIYALGLAYTGKLSHADLGIDSAYNTYRFRGLPPTPIATVGKEAIDAAAHPHPSDYLYYVAKGDGTHQFSQTYEQQKKAIGLYQRKDRYGKSTGEITRH
jgi:UPF0755 protein